MTKKINNIANNLKSNGKSATDRTMKKSTQLLELKKIFNKKIEESEIKKSQNLLDSHKLLFVNRCDNHVEALFKDAKDAKDVNIKTILYFDNNMVSSCSCKKNVKICLHLLGLALHYIKYFKDTSKKNNSNKPLSYSGLKEESLVELSNSLSVKYDAKVNLYIEDKAPHAPSKWEKCNILVKIIYKNKEYSGNIGNLRQLNFGKGIGCGVDILQFHPQDRQIIRFLAINSESDGRSVTIEAESVAEFFHCLTGFNRCFFDGVPLFIHRDTAEAVLIYRKLKDGYAIKPAIIADVGTVTLKNAKMVIGRAGCWISIALDYWWIPGNIDLLWLRNFLRSYTMQCSKVQADDIIQKASSSAIRVINSTAPDAPFQKKCIPLYSANYAKNGTFELQLEYSYGDTILPSGGSSVGSSKSAVWQRDRKREMELELELSSIGFKRKEFSGKNIFILESQEAAGMFLDCTLPAWLAENRSIFLSANLATFISGNIGVEELQFKCLDIIDMGSKFHIQYDIITRKTSGLITWKNILKSIKNNDHYISSNGEIIGSISLKLAEFANATSNFTEVRKDKKQILEIPRSSAIYWGNEFFKLNGFKPTILEELEKSIPEVEGDIFKHISSATRDKQKLEDEDLIENSDKVNIIKSITKIKPTGKYKLSAKLRSYQLDGVRWMQTMLKNRFNIILADEMGLGKTVQTLALLIEDKNSQQYDVNRPSLLVCPSSLIDNWQLEAVKFTPQLKTLIIRGSKREESLNKIRENDLIILSYTIAARTIDELQKHEFNFLILDEAQHIKNPSTVNAKTCKSINAEKKVVLTGTPMENSPDELWSLFDFLQPKMLGTIAGFKKRYADIANSSILQSDLVSRTAPFILRRKKDDVEPDLPKKVVQTIYCEMSNEQRKIYDDFREKGLECFDSFVKKGQNSRFDLLSNLLRLRQICCHPELLPIDTKGATLPSAKTELLQELLLEALDSGHKVLLFSQFTSFLTIIKKWLIKEKINFEYLDGGTKDRIQRVQNFNNNDNIPLFLLSLKAGGVGLNLTSADRVIIYDPWWNPAVEAQATDRTHRIGQTKSVYSMKLVVRNSIEEKILKLQAKKQQIFSSLVENKSTSLKQLSNEDLEFLLT